VLRCGPLLPQVLRQKNEDFWNLMYKVKDERGNLKGMKSLYAKRTHLMKDGPLFGYYDGVIVHGTMCEDCQLGSKHPIELSTDETLLAPL